MRATGSVGVPGTQPEQLTLPSGWIPHMTLGPLSMSIYGPGVMPPGMPSSPQHLASPSGSRAQPTHPPAETSRNCPGGVPAVQPSTPQQRTLPLGVKPQTIPSPAERSAKRSPVGSRTPLPLVPQQVVRPDADSMPQQK